MNTPFKEKAIITMKIPSTTQAGYVIGALVLFTSAVPISAQTTYTFGPTGGGYQEIAFADGGNPNSGNPYGTYGILPGYSTMINLSSLGGSITYNQAAGTIDVQENYAANQANISGAFSDTHDVYGHPVPATVLVNAAVGNNGIVSFDSGPVSENYITVPGQAPIPLNKWQVNVPVPITGSYSFITGGQTNTGAFSYSLFLNAQVSLNGASDTNLSFTWHAPGLTDRGPLLADVEASNAITLQLVAADPSDGAVYNGWNLTATATPAAPVSAVPETMGLAIPVFAMIGLGVAHRRLRKPKQR